MTPGGSSPTPIEGEAVGSLCSGYGGLDLGLELGLGVSLRHAWHVEYDKHPSAILAARFPGVPNYGDVKTAPWDDMQRVDWLTAGYPCQPFSLAGLRKGADDPRHLWPGVARAIGVLRPRHVLLENVAAHLRDGFDTVLADFAAMGYDASWGVVRASDAGAPHGRARLFVVAADADTDHDGRRRAGTVEPGRVGGLEARTGSTRDSDRPGATRDGRPDSSENPDGAACGERWQSTPGQAQGGRSRADAGRTRWSTCCRRRWRATAEGNQPGRIGHQMVCRMRWRSYPHQRRRRAGRQRAQGTAPTSCCCRRWRRPRQPGHCSRRRERQTGRRVDRTSGGHRAT